MYIYIVACNIELLLAQSSAVIAVGDAGTDTVTNEPHKNNPGGQHHEIGKYTIIVMSSITLWSVAGN